jgi:hypothetical protein
MLEQNVSNPLNVVGAPLCALQRVQALVEFLDLISLQRLSMSSRAEKDAGIDKSCVWYVFNKRLSGCMPSPVIERIKANKSLKGLHVTLPFKLKEIATFQSKQIQILNLRNVLTAQSVPLLVKIIGDQPLLQVLGLSGNGLDKRDAEKAAKIRQIAAQLGADRVESKTKFLQKAEILDTGGLPLLMTCLCTTNITALDLSANAITEDGNEVACCHC